MEKLNRDNFHSNIIYTFIFGLLWGILEIIASEFLVSNNFFVRGLIVSSIAVFVLTLSKSLAKYKFSLLIVGAIASILILSSRGLQVNIAIAIFSEALIAELIYLSPKQNQITSMVIGALIFLYSFAHGLIFHGSLPGSFIFYQYNKLFESLFGSTVNKDSYFILIIFFGLICLIAGVIIGWLCFKFINRYKKRIVTGIDNLLLIE